MSCSYRSSNRFESAGWEPQPIEGRPECPVGPPLSLSVHKASVGQGVQRPLGRVLRHSHLGCHHPNCSHGRRSIAVRCGCGDEMLEDTPGDRTQLATQRGRIRSDMDRMRPLDHGGLGDFHAARLWSWFWT